MSEPGIRGAGGELDRLLDALSADAYWRREEALDELSRVREPGPLLDGLEGALADEGNAERRNAARSALAALAAPGAGASEAALARLRGMLGAPDADVRLLAATALGESSNPEARAALETALDDADPNVAASAADALGELGDPRAADALTAVLRSESFWMRAAAAAALGRLHDPRAVPALAAAAEDPELTGIAAAAIGEIADPSGLDALRPTLARNPESREQVLESIAAILGAHPQLDPPGWLREAAAQVEERLIERFVHSGDEAAARLLGVAGTARAAELLIRCLGTPGRDAAASAGIALIPPSLATGLLLGRLPDAPSEERALLIWALPPLEEASSAWRLVAYLSDDDPQVRAAASEALGRSPAEVVLPVLREAIRSPAARLGAARAYGRLGEARCDPLEGILSDPHPDVRAAAAEGLARCGPVYGERLRDALRRESDPVVQQVMARALGSAGGAGAAEELAALVRSPDLALRFAAVEALGRTGAPEAYPPLLEALTDEHPEVQAAALHALGELGDPRAVQPLGEHLADSDRDLRRTAAFALDRLTPVGAVDRLIAALRDPDREVRLTAVRILERVTAPSSLDELQRVADSERDPLVRHAACRAVEVVRARAAKAG